MAKALSLLKAYQTEAIPTDGGFIVSAFFEGGSGYGMYEVTAYRNVKDIYISPEGLTFKTDGNRTHLLVEPSTFAKKFVEPVHRDSGRGIPYRFAELETIITHRKDRIFIPREPIMLYASFTILKSDGDSFAFVFYPTKDVYMAMKKFIADSLYNDCRLGKKDAIAGSETVLETIKKFTIFGS